MTIREVFEKQDDKDKFEEGFRWNSDSIVIKETGVQNGSKYIDFYLTDYSENAEYHFKAFLDVPLPFSGTSYRSGNYSFVFELRGPRWCALYHLVEVKDLTEPQTAKDIYDNGVDFSDAGQYDKAVECYRKAADMGFAKAQYNLGVCYYHGKGVTKNDVKAAEWWQKAADQGHTDAKHNLGVLKNNNSQSAPAPQGNPQAANDLYNNGVAAYKRKDYAEAVKCWQKAADQGNAKAQWDLGAYYMNGEGVTEDAVKVATLIRKAQNQGVDPGMVLGPNGSVKCKMTFQT